MLNKKWIRIARYDQETILLDSVRFCKSCICRLFGLQFRRQLEPGEGILLAFGQESVLASSIHMFFVFFPIAAIWINKEGSVTHKALALPWHPYYASPTPACYVLEAHPEILNKIKVGDQLEFI